MESNEHGALLSEAERSDKIVFIYNAIRDGADGFLFAEYGRCLVFSVVFGALVFVLTSRVRAETCDTPDSDGKCPAEWCVYSLLSLGKMVALTWVATSVAHIGNSRREDSLPWLSLWVPLRPLRAATWE